MSTARLSAAGLTSVARTAIPRSPLAELAADRIRRLVLDGSLAPGERLGAVALSARRGVSPIPLRKAFKILAQEGLVVLQPNREARERPLDPAALEHAIEVMAVLEELVGRLAARRMGEDELQGLRQTHRAMQ